MSGHRFKNILVVVKQTPYESYTQLRAQGKAPVALRWERLRNRYNAHKKCVDSVTEVLKKSSANYVVIGREDLHRDSVVDKDLVIAVGGDGTILNTSSFIDDTIPVLGVNSDPTMPHEKGVNKPKDERRSRGALCGTDANTIVRDLPFLLDGSVIEKKRSRVRCLVRSAYTETKMPPALNDILICHPSPAAVSRFRLGKLRGKVDSYREDIKQNPCHSLNIWSR